MKILMHKADFEQLYRHALAQKPEEACGLIAGDDRPDGVREIKKVYLLTNSDHAADHFSITPEDQLTALKDIRLSGLTLLGNWHSHPETPSRPSEEDKRLAHDSKASYLILSLAAAEPVLNAFHIEGPLGERLAEKEELIIIEN